MELFWLEHKKLWRKKIVKICVLLCFVYCVIFGSILSFQWFGFGSSDDYTSAFGNNFDGYTVIKDSQEYALSFGGELTDETLQQIVSDYLKAFVKGVRGYFSYYLRRFSLCFCLNNAFQPVLRSQTATMVKKHFDFIICFALLNHKNSIRFVFLRMVIWDG